MSSSIRGVRDLDGKFAQMIAIKEACEKANVSYPQEVKDYFKYPGESVEFLKQDMEEIDISHAVTESTHDATERYDVDLSKLSIEVTRIRFENSW